MTRFYSLGEGISCPHCGHALFKEPFIFHGLAFDDPNGKTQVSYEGAKIPIPAQQATVLLILARAPGRVVTREFLYETMYYHLNGDGPNVKIFDTVVCLLRGALVKYKIPMEIETIWGRGFRLVVQEQKADNVA